MIEVDIVTPTKKVVQGLKGDSVSLPGVKGQITVLPGHTELITLLETGPLIVKTGSTETKFAVSYGFAEVRSDKVTVLAETAESASEIDVERAKRAKKKAEEAMAAVLTEEQFKKQQAKLQRAIIRTQVSS